MANPKARIRLVEEHVRRENEHDLARVMATFGGQARYDDEPWDEHHDGRGAVEAYYATLLAALPDLHIDVRRRHVTDDAIVLEVIISGTHVGAWHGLPGTGRRVEIPLCGIFTFDENDRLLGEKIYYDRATVLRQIGLYPLLHPAALARSLARSLFNGRRRPSATRGSTDRS